MGYGEKDSNLQEEFEFYAKKLIDEDEYPSRENICRAIGERFQEARPPNNRKLSSPIITEYGGLALTPGGAVECLYDSSRTTRFAQGLYVAIKSAMAKFPERPIRVLEAGSGPYSLLSMLVAPFFKPGEVEFIPMDIYEESTSHVKEFASNLGQSGKFGTPILGDATTIKLGNPKPHIIIAETMNQLLEEEPQVQVTANLGDQTVEGGFFLPEKIELYAHVGSSMKQSFMKQSQEAPSQDPIPKDGKDGIHQEDVSQETIPQGVIVSSSGVFAPAQTIFTLTRDIAERVKRNGEIDKAALEEVLHQKFEIVSSTLIRNINRVVFGTRIQIFDNVTLKASDGSILTREKIEFLPDNSFSKIFLEIYMGTEDRLLNVTTI